MKPFITTTKGSCIKHEIQYTDEEGTPIDITDYQFSVFESVPSIIKTNTTFTVENAAEGKVEMYLDAESALSLQLGSANWFRLSIVDPHGCRETTEKIGIVVE